MQFATVPAVIAVARTITNIIESNSSIFERQLAVNLYRHAFLYIHANLDYKLTIIHEFSTRNCSTVLAFTIISPTIRKTNFTPRW